MVVLTTLLELVLGMLAVPLVIADPTGRYALALGTPEETIGAATVGVAHGTYDAAHATATDAAQITEADATVVTWKKTIFVNSSALSKLFYSIECTNSLKVTYTFTLEIILSVIAILVN